MVLNCRCGKFRMIALEDLIEVYSRDLDVNALGRAGRCSRCKNKKMTDMQIIYIGGSQDAINAAAQANSDYQAEE